MVSWKVRGTQGGSRGLEAESENSVVLRHLNRNPSFCLVRFLCQSCYITTFKDYNVTTGYRLLLSSLYR